MGRAVCFDKNKARCKIIKYTFPHTRKPGGSMNARSFGMVAVLAAVSAAGLAFMPTPNQSSSNQTVVAADSCAGYAYFRPAPYHPPVINYILEVEGMWAVVKEGDGNYTFHPRPEYTDDQRQEVLRQVQILLNHIADINGHQRVRVHLGESHENGIVPIAPKPSSPDVVSEPVISQFCRPKKAGPTQHIA